MKNKIVLLVTAIALTLVLGGCEFFGFLFSGSDRILTLQVKATHPNLANGYQTNAILTQGESEGKIFATLPAGTNSSVQIEFTLDSGSLKVAGQTVSSPATVNLSAVDKVYYVDPVGFEYPYVLDIAPTGLPTVFIATDGALPIDSKDVYRKGTITIADGTASYSEPLANTVMEIKGRGNSTWGPLAEKKPYKFRILDPTDNTKTIPTAMLDMPAATEWVLLANYFDKTLIRNAVVMKTAQTVFSDTMGFVPRMRFVDVFLNGAYNGVYTLGDQVEVGANRLNIADTTTADADKAYLVEVNRWIRDRDGGVLGTDYFQTAEAGLVLEYKTPKASKISSSQKTWLSTRFAAIETELKNAYDQVPGADFAQYLDTNSFIDWAILEEAFRNTDSGFISSVFLHKDGGAASKFKIGPLWDFDLSAGNTDLPETPVDANDIGLRSTSGVEVLSTDWYNWMFYTGGDTQYRTAFKNRWAAKASTLKTTILDAIDEYSDLVERSGLWQETDTVYNLSDDTWPNAYPVGLSRAEYTTRYKTWIEDRFDWLETNIPGNNF
jgi:hypothetical protein